MTATRLPKELVAGDTWTFRRSLADYPASAWTLAYYFKNATGAFSIAAAEVVADGDEFVLTKAAADTASIAAGRYAWQSFASRASPAERFIVEEGEVVVRPNFAAAGNLDARSDARRGLDAVNAYLANGNNLSAASYQIGGRTLSRYPIRDLLKLKAALEYEVAKEDAQNGGARPGREFVRFTR